MRFKFFLASAAFLLVTRGALGAPCCAGGAATPAIITGDDSAQVSLMATRSSIIGDAPAEGIAVFRADGDSQITQTLRFDAATLISDRFQTGISAPLVQQAISRPGVDAQATRVGDLRLSGAYEALPEWTYSEWKPKGHVFMQLTLPTARSIYDAKSFSAVDAIGKGFYTVLVGGILTKRWSVWDAYAIPEVHYLMPRSFQNQALDETLRVSPGGGASLSLGVGCSPGGGAFRAGLRLQPFYLQRKLVQSESATTQANYQQSWDTSLEASYLIASAWSLFGSYTDQTLIGPAVNSTLSRTVALGMQHRWER